MSAPNEITSRLAQALVIEGSAQTPDELQRLLHEQGLFTWASDTGFLNISTGVILFYKPAAAMNDPKGFLVFANFTMASVSEVSSRSSVMGALALHNAATGFGRGGQLDEQKRLNEEALELLEGIVVTANRDADWEVVRSKVMAGLYENGHREWNEIFYRIEVLEPMTRLRFKDEAGRRHYFAQKLRDEGHLEDARKVLLPVREDTWSASNQRERAGALLDALELELGGVHSPI